jgi:serine/threonine-protein kinase HipA
MSGRRTIEVCAHWVGMKDPMRIGILHASVSRGKETFHFEYAKEWLESGHALILDPHLQFYEGPQYPRDNNPNFGVFLDSSPDRWGKLLMQRREAQMARLEKRDRAHLHETDYLLGVFDGHRMGALRFRYSEDSPFLDDNQDMASPPWARLRDLEYASLQLENENAEENPEYMQWLKMLIAPGGSLGGARPKAGVVDEQGQLWIAKFPSQRDDINIGKWEYLVYELAQRAKIDVAHSHYQCFSGRHDTFITKRFDRTDRGERIHFASAMTLLGKKDGDGGDTGVSYLDLAEFLIQHGAQTSYDLEQLWRRIVFNICVSNVDDHLRNHGFLLTDKGWVLSPAYDMNPSATSNGLTLNISKEDNAQDIDLVLEVAPTFRIKDSRAKEIVAEVIGAVKEWETISHQLGLPGGERDGMSYAFRVAK